MPELSHPRGVHVTIREITPEANLAQKSRNKAEQNTRHYARSKDIRTLKQKTVGGASVRRFEENQIRYRVKYLSVVNKSII